MKTPTPLPDRSSSLPELARNLGVAELAQLSPSELASRLERRLAYYEQGYAVNTQRAWSTAWRTWRNFCRANGWALLPTTVERIQMFLETQIVRGKKRATLELYVYTLGVVHQVVELDNPMHGTEGKLMWRGLRHKKMTARQRQAEPLRIETIETIVAMLDLEDERDLRDATLLRVAYDLMGRRSELVKLKVEDLQLRKGIATVARSKTDQAGEGSDHWLSPKSCELMQQYLAKSGVRQGPMFRSIRRSAKADGLGQPLSDRDVSRIFKRLAARAGMDPSKISGHSARVGAAQDLYTAQIPTAQIMHSGRWKSERMVVTYTREIAAHESGMAQFQTRRKQRQIPAAE